MKALEKGNIKRCYCVENNCAIEFVDGIYTKTITAGGKAYLIEKDGDNITKKEL